MMRALTRKTEVAEEIWLFHITHRENLPSIAQSGALLSWNELKRQGLEPRSIAYAHLQERRHQKVVSVAPGGDLHDYVPWQFAARPPMLLALASGALEKTLFQDDIVHLMTTVERVQREGASFVFCDGHPLADLTVFSGDLARLPTQLDWETLQARRWNNTEADPDRKRRRQAEFLVQKSVSWNVVRGLAVRTEAARRDVEELLQGVPCPKIAVIPDWYYQF